MRHAKFAAKLEEVITDPAKLGVKLRADNVDIAYPPIVQSGGVHDLRASAASDDRHLQYDVITASIGASRCRGQAGAGHWALYAETSVHFGMHVRFDAPALLGASMSVREEQCENCIRFYAPTDPQVPICGCATWRARMLRNTEHASQQRAGRAARRTACTDRPWT